MRILHLTGKDYKTSTWSGGTTTELFIWPKGADYAKREFSFRISSASVDLAESDFTALPGVQRWITPLQGSFTLTHPGCARIVMAPLDTPYCFSGEIATHCVGQATDFNLMLKGIPGKMAVYRGTAPVLPGFNCFYAAIDTVFYLEGQYSMAAGDLLVVFSQGAATVELGAEAVIACHVEGTQWEDI